MLASFRLDSYLDQRGSFSSYLPWNVSAKNVRTTSEVETMSRCLSPVVILFRTMGWRLTRAVPAVATGILYLAAIAHSFEPQEGEQRLFGHNVDDFRTSAPVIFGPSDLDLETPGWRLGQLTLGMKDRETAKQNLVHYAEQTVARLKFLYALDTTQTHKLMAAAQYDIVRFFRSIAKRPPQEKRFVRMTIRVDSDFFPPTSFLAKSLATIVSPIQQEQLQQALRDSRFTWLASATGRELIDWIVYHTQPTRGQTARLHSLFGSHEGAKNGTSAHEMLTRLSAVDRQELELILTEEQMAKVAHVLASFDSHFDWQLPNEPPRG